MTATRYIYIYIGQTGRWFRERFKEHLPKSKITKLERIKSNYARHLMAVSYTHLDVYKRQSPYFHFLKEHGSKKSCD